jgi:serine/threonine protein phosphatase PrpC
MSMARLPNTFTIKARLKKDVLVYAWGQKKGTRKSQEDYVANLGDECFIVTDGVGGMPHGKTAAIFTAETALWGYKHIRLRRFYWADKRLLVKRIFRSSNIALWQKRGEHGFEKGLATTLSIVIVGGQKIWVGSVGDTRIILYRDGLIDFLTPADIDESGRLADALGLKRFGLVPHVAVERFLLNDTICIASDGLMNYLNEDELRTAFEMVGNTKESMTSAITKLLAIACDHGGTDNMTACMIKRVI